MPAKTEDALRQEILKLVTSYAEIKYKPVPFVAGETHVPVSGKVLGSTELEYLVDSSLDGWLTTGRYNDQFEEKLAKFLGVKHVLTTNSGSSANLLAFSTLTSPKLGDDALKPGDEVIAVAAGFPTTVNPVLQYGLVPVFVDVDIPTYNVDAVQLETAVSDKTRAIMIAHTLGNAFNIDVVMQLARKYNLWVIEDCCDALGTTYTPKQDSLNYKGKSSSSGKSQHVGTFGDIATLSFYPAHHVTMGEGGAVFTNNGKLKLIIESFRDWGRDCYCEPGKDNTCNKRFCWQLGELPEGYDHKYIYSHVGYNLKITDMQAAVGLAQIDKLPDFVNNRKKNFSLLKDRLKSLEEFIILPKATSNCDPSWFGFPISLREGSAVKRVELLQYLDKHKIGTRLLFAGNLTKQPYFKDKKYRVSGVLKNTDFVMNNTFWIGVYPGLSNAMLLYVCDKLESYFGVNTKD